MFNIEIQKTDALVCNVFVQKPPEVINTIFKIISMKLDLHFFDHFFKKT